MWHWVRIRAVDTHGNVLPFYQEPVRITAEGDIAIIGPDTIALQGGMGGTYVKTSWEIRSGNFVITVPDRRGNKDTVSGYGLISGENQRERIRVTL